MQLTLTAARKRKGWSIPKLATESGVHKSTVLRLERGDTHPTLATVEHLEAALSLKRGSLTFSYSEYAPS